MKLIVNADDFGYSNGVNWGIADAYRYGIVRSATIMPNMPGFSHAVEVAKQNPGLGVGVHLVLTGGGAVTGVNKTITDGNGNFMKPDALAKSLPSIDLDEVEREYIAQIERVVSNGIKPSHMDSHHHAHMLPGIFSVFVKIAQRYGLPIRLLSRGGSDLDVKAPDLLITDFFSENTGVNLLIELLEQHKDSEKIVEVMCHPAYMDQAIYTGSSYNVQRMRELEALTSVEIAGYIRDNDIELMSFRDFHV